MPFSLDDMLEKIGLGGQKTGYELYREELASIQTMNASEILKLFPNVTLSESQEVVYAPFKLCHSLPKVNALGRAFTPRVLANSFASVRDGLVNIDHQMSYRGNATNDKICGHIVCGRFDPEGKWNDEVASKAALPTDPIPLLALAAFYLRSEHIPQVLQEHLSGKRKWLTSMECAHNWDDAAFLYRGEVVPIADAESGMRESVQKTGIKPYKGHQLSLLLGGEKGKVDFHSMGLTPNPADEDADILAFVTRRDMPATEAASKGNPFFFPLETRTYKNHEGRVQEDEIANISVIGKTEPAEDGHTHDVLTDGTIVPTNGHTHYLSSWGLSRGTNPTFSGRTDTHYEYYREQSSGRELTKVHMHMLSISLKGKGKPSDSTVVPMDDAASLPGADLLPIPTNIKESDMDLQALLKRFSAVLSSGKFEGAAATEAASLTADLAKIGQEANLKSLLSTEIANQVKDGTLYTKEGAEKLRDEAVKSVTDKAEEEKKIADQRTKRREKVLALGFNLEDGFTEDNDMTIGQYVDSFSLDAVGEKSFGVALATLENLKKQVATAEAATAAAAQTGTETVAANKAGGGKAGGDKAASKKKLLLVGGGSGGDEAANDAGGGKPDEKKVGRHLFRTAV